MNDDQWKEKLSEEQYHVLREKGTELPFTGELLHNKAEGTYRCAGCGAELFDSDTKFDSGSGWPSFSQAKPDTVRFEQDSSLGMSRTEVLCARCGGHLGHVFDDGPEMVHGKESEGKRYCINSCALDFKEM